MSKEPLSKIYPDYNFGTGDEQVPDYKRWIRAERAAHELSGYINAAIDRINAQQEQIDGAFQLINDIAVKLQQVGELEAKYEGHTHELATDPTGELLYETERPSHDQL